MDSKLILAAVAALVILVSAQQPYEYTSEVHPSLPSKRSPAQGCTTINTSIVIDSNYRWLHSLGRYSPCVPSGNVLTLNIFTQSGNVTSASSPRVYLLAENETYDMFKLLNQEIAFDIDVSRVLCGINGALYLCTVSVRCICRR